MIKIGVAKKKTDHPYYGKGSSYSFTVDGKEGHTIHLIKGEVYTFDIDARNHPFFFTTDPVGGNGSKDSLMAPNEAVTDKGTETFYVRDDLPNNFYYQCQKHPYMGGKVKVVDKNEEALMKYLMM